MKIGRLLRLSLLCSILLVCLPGCKANRKPHQALHTQYSSRALRQDFDQMIAIIEKNHPALFDFTAKKEFDSVIEAQAARISDSLTLVGFYRILAPVVLKLGCGHSKIWLPTWVWTDSLLPVFPLRLFFANQRAYVLADFSRDKEIDPGTEILSVNGQTVAQLKEQMEGFESTDGNNISAKEDILNTPWSAALLSITQEFPSEYRLELQRAGEYAGTQKKVSAVSLKSYNEMNAKSKPNLRFELDSSKRVAILTIKSFAYYDSVQGFRKFIDSCFLCIKERGISELVLDLRGNGGGDPYCAAPILSYLENEPLPYYARDYEGYEELARPIPLADNHFTGHLHILIDGQGFSTTGHFCALLRYHKLGEFIGSQTDGTYTCNDNSIAVDLKHTGMKLRIARNTYTVAVKNIPRFQGIMPDFPIITSIEDALSGRDPVMAFALSRCR